MNLLEIFQAAFKSLAANKLRSGLTMLGVIIGVAAVVSMISIVEGGSQRIMKAIERLGTNILFVSTKELKEDELRKFGGRSKGLKYGDAQVIAAKVPYVKEVAPVVSIPVKVRYGEKDFDGTVSGTTPDYQEVRNFYADQGRFISQADIDNWERVAVIGQDVAKRLFGDENPVHKEVKIGEERFTVVGVMEKKGGLHGINFDEMIFAPVTTIMRRFRGNELISNMLVQVTDLSHMNLAEERMRELLLRRHEGVEDFEIHSPEEFLRLVNIFILVMGAMLGGIAGLSLLVGGIGIMNIMLVTVTERTGEIGLRKAVGATRGDILKHFLIESVTISVFGGLIGIALGILLGTAFGYAVSHAFMSGSADWGAVISIKSILVAFLFAVGVGIFFGLYPARKASRLDPAEALRYE
jgi:putative ABC transport system permease protein